MIRNLLRFAGWRHVRRKPGRFFLTVFGISLGVALFVSTSAINTSTLAFFKQNVDSLIGKASFSILGTEVGFAEDLVEEIRKVPGVKSAVPMIENRTRQVNGKTLVVFGLDLLQESAVRSYQTESQHREEVVDDPLVFLNQEDSIIVTKSLAAQHRLALESPIELITAVGKKRFTVRGLLEPQGLARAYGGDIAIMDIDGARVMFGKEGKVDRVDIVPEDGVDRDALAKRLETAVASHGLRVERTEDQAAALSRLVEGYQTVLSFFSLLALIVGMFLVANTIAVAVAERRREIAVLRALGASKRGILFMFILETAWMGVVGGLIGVALGRVLAKALIGEVSAGMSNQFLTPIDVSEIEFSSDQAIAGVVAGIVAAVLAAIWPAWKAAGVQGTEAFGAGPASLGPTSQRTRRTTIVQISGSIMLAAFGIIALSGVTHPVVATLNPVLGVLGAILVAPLLVAGALRCLDFIVSPHGPLRSMYVLRLCVQNLRRDPTRTGSNVLSLMIGLILVTNLTVIQYSLRRSIGDHNEQALRSDLWVSSIGRILMNDVQPLAETVGAEIDRVPGVDVVDGQGARGFRVVHNIYEGEQITVESVDRQHPRVGNAMFDVIDRPVDDAVREMFEAGSQHKTLVSQNFAVHFHKTTGDSFELRTPTGLQQFKIVGVVSDYESPIGTMYLSRQVYKRIWNDSLVTSFAVVVRPEFSVDQVRSDIETRLTRLGVVATNSAELRTQLDQIMDENFAYANVTELGALGVGLSALLGTLLMSLLARMRELGMLRAIGLSRWQLVRMILGEAILLGLLGGIVASALGVYLSKLWVVSSLAESLGWFVRVHIPWLSVLSTVGAGMAVGVIVGLICARRVAKLEIREALEAA